MRGTLDGAARDLLFLKARTHNGWRPETVTEALLRAVYDLAKWGPTSANSMPARFVFVTSPAAKEKLAPALSSGNLAKTMAAPVTAIVAHDTQFYELLAEQWPHDPSARSWFDGTPAGPPTAFRNGTLQGAYLMIAARALGLDCGPMSGFDAARVDAAFFPDGRFKTNFLCNIGYGDDAKVRPRGPRLPFERACAIV